MLKAFAKTLREHLAGILAYYNFPISTAALEGTNNKIKTMKDRPMGSEILSSSNSKSWLFMRQGML